MSKIDNDVKEMNDSKLTTLELLSERRKDLDRLIQMEQTSEHVCIEDLDLIQASLQYICTQIDTLVVNRRLAVDA